MPAISSNTAYSSGFCSSCYNYPCRCNSINLYPVNVYPTSYTIYTKPIMNKTDKAFKIIEKLIEKGIIKEDISGKELIEITNIIAEELN